MSNHQGRNLAVSPFRQVVTDLMHFSRQVPSVCIDRPMNLGRVIAARQLCQPRPSWTALFTKAFSLVAARIPELRRTYMPYPYPYFYEHPKNVVSINVARQWQQENVVLQAQIRSPENRTLEDIDGILRHFREDPLQEIKCFRRMLNLMKTPWPLRRVVWWTGLNLSGRMRVHNFGTFGIGSIAAQGAGIQRIMPILTATVHYGMLDDAGNLEMRLSFDHRVLDGTDAARALVDMENVLHQEILDEMAGQRSALAA